MRVVTMRVQSIYVFAILEQRGSSSKNQINLSYEICVILWPCADKSKVLILSDSLFS